MASRDWMKIGICARTWGEKGGIGVYTRHLIRSMVELESDHEYHILYSDPKHLKSLPPAERTREVFLPAKGKWMWDQWAVPRYASRERLDVILHTKLSIPFLARSKTAMVVHGTERYVHPQFHRRVDLWYIRTVYQAYLKRASLILAVSNRARDDLITLAGIDPNRVRVTYLAADPTFRVIEDSGELRRVRDKFSLPERFLLFAGHIYPGKNFGRLIEAFQEVRREHDVDLVVAGGLRWGFEGDLARVRELDLENRVHFLGHVEHGDLAALYNLAEAAVFPSHYESFGLINVEAQACGCPLVTSSTGGSPEAAGEAAVYVDPLSVPDIAAGITRVLADPELRTELVEKGLANYRRFSWERTARETIEVLEAVVAPAEAT